MTNIRVTRNRALLLAGTACALTLAAPGAAWAGDCSAATLVTGTVERLTADCTTTVGLVIPAGVTSFDGQGHTITAVDPAGGAFGDDPNSLGTYGDVIEADDDPNLTVRNVTVQAATGASSGLNGIELYNTSATLTGVTVRNLPGDATYGIRDVYNLSTPGKLTLTNSSVTGYGYEGVYVYAEGSPLTTVVSNSTIGPANAAAQRDSYVFGLDVEGGSATLSGNRVTAATVSPYAVQFAVYLAYLTGGSTFNGNTIRGDSNFGVYLYDSGNGVRITSNRILDQGPDASAFGSEDFGVSLVLTGATVVSGNTIQCFQVPVAVNEVEVNPGTFGPNTVSNAGCPTAPAVARAAARSARR